MSPDQAEGISALSGEVQVVPLTDVTAGESVEPAPVSSSQDWPPKFTLDQPHILKLLTGDRFYSNPSAALREAVLNAVDAIGRRARVERDLDPNIKVVFNQEDLTLSVHDNGDGMGQEEISQLFAKVGASAAEREGGSSSVGEFGIGVVSYFMAADRFELETCDGTSAPIGLSFVKEMLTGGSAEEYAVGERPRGSTVTMHIRTPAIFDLLLKSFPHWCRDVMGLTCAILPKGETMPQGDAQRRHKTVALQHPNWIEKTHLGPIADPIGWDAMTGNSSIAVLYRGVFVQEFNVKGTWGIVGSIDVDPKHFKPRLNREGFIEGEFEREVSSFLKAAHPQILEAMSAYVAAALADAKLNKWTQKKWATLWLTIPRSAEYRSAAIQWDAVFRRVPAFERAVGNNWIGASFDEIRALGTAVYMAPHAEEKTDEIIDAAVRLLRNTGRPLVRGLRRDRGWMPEAKSAFGTTADLIASVFESDLPELISVRERAEALLAAVERVAPLYTGPPSVDIVRIGSDGPPALRLKSRLVLNIDNPAGARIVNEALEVNLGHMMLISLAARHAIEQMGQVAAVVREISGPDEPLSPVRRRFIRNCLP